MSDITKRLRDWSKDMANGWIPRAGEKPASLAMNEAADEIERLRAECERLRNQLSVANAYARGSKNI